MSIGKYFEKPLQTVALVSGLAIAAAGCSNQTNSGWRFTLVDAAGGVKTDSVAGKNARMAEDIFKRDTGPYGVAQFAHHPNMADAYQNRDTSKD